MQYASMHILVLVIQCVMVTVVSTGSRVVLLVVECTVVDVLVLLISLIRPTQSNLFGSIVKHRLSHQYKYYSSPVHCKAPRAIEQ